MPNQFELMWPTLQAIIALGGSGTTIGIDRLVIACEGFTLSSNRSNDAHPTVGGNSRITRHGLGTRCAISRRC